MGSSNRELARRMGRFLASFFLPALPILGTQTSEPARRLNYNVFIILKAEVNHPTKATVATDMMVFLYCSGYCYPTP